MRPYELNVRDKAEAQKQLKAMLENGIIRPADSEYNSPAIFVNKKIIDAENNIHADRRMCIDLRALNKKTQKINFPIPNIDSTLRNLSGSKFFTTLDILSGFWHLGLTENSKKYTAFTLLNGKWEFNVLPFGWVNAPFHFQLYMQRKIADRLPKFTQVYIDDVVIFSRTEEEHLDHIKQVIAVIEEEGIHLKLAKCSFFNKEIEYLGHIISADGIKKDPRKVAIIKNMHEPSNRKEVRSFLGN
jgi:hypothetical protein